MWLFIAICTAVAVFAAIAFIMAVVDHTSWEDEEANNWKELKEEEEASTLGLPPWKPIPPPMRKMHNYKPKEYSWKTKTEIYTFVDDDLQKELDEVAKKEQKYQAIKDRRKQQQEKQAKLRQVEEEQASVVQSSDSIEGFGSF